MGHDNMELVGAAEDRGNRLRRKRNHAFREQLEEEKRLRRERLRLRLAATAAGLSWAVAGWQVLM